MDFSLTPEQELLHETARGLLVRECPPSLLRACQDDRDAARPLWHHLVGFSALATAPVVDRCLFGEEAGRVALPGPFFATTFLYAPVLAALGAPDQTELVLAGEETGTVALAGADGLWTPNAEPTKTFVLDADIVDVVVAVDAAGVVTRLEDPPRRLVETVDWTRRAFEVDAAGNGRELGRLAPHELEAILEAATAVLAAELVGTAARILAMAVEHAKHRVQFGVPIGSFQAVQHMLADSSLDVERARSAVGYAAMTLDAGDDARHRAVHVAKAAAGEAAKRAVKTGVQVHGGIGYTWEHDLHLFVRRAVAAEALLGPTGWHHDRLAEALLGSAAPRDAGGAVRATGAARPAPRASG